MGIQRVGFGAAADVRVSSALDGVWMHRALCWAHELDPDGLVRVAPDTRCCDADERARALGVRHLFVTAPSGRLVGVLCRCDLYPEPAPTDVVADRMSSHIYALAPSASLAEAAAAMATLGVGCLPVVQHDRAIGVVTRGDLRRAGVPEALLGAGRCAACGSHRGVRPDTHSGIEYCLDCIDLFDALGDARDFGEGD